MRLGAVVTCARALWVVVVSTLLVAFLPSLPAQGAPGTTRDGVPVVKAREVRPVWTGEFGMERPLGVAYVASRNELVVVAAAADGRTEALRLGFDENQRGAFSFVAVRNPSSLAYDESRDTLTVLSGTTRVELGGGELSDPTPASGQVDVARVGFSRARGSAFDPETGTWYVLDRRAGAVLRTTSDGATTSIPLPPGADAPRGPLAFNARDGLLYYMVADGDTVHAIGDDGEIVKTFDLRSVELRNPRAMTFAPSSDNTDRWPTLNLFIADRGSRRYFGGVVEVSMVNPGRPDGRRARALRDAGTLVRMTPTSAFSPASPDPAGVVWRSDVDKLVIVDSEVDETTGAGYNGVNLWETNRLGGVLATGTLHPTWSSEPTGAGYDPATDTLFVSDDSKRRVFVIKPGPNGSYGNGDDVVTYVGTSAYGSSDTEDPYFDTTTGLLYQLDGASTQIYVINPVDGTFGNGNDTVTNFDIGHLGPADFEGLAGDPSRNSLYVGARTGDQIFEITKTGAYIRTISLASVPDLRFVSGLEVAPASNGSGAMNFYVVDRAIDNGPDPNENDGKLFEILDSGGGGPVNQPPTVNAGADQTLTFPNTSTTLSGTVSDDGLPAGSTVTQQWTVVSPAGAAVSFGSPTSAVTTASFPEPGVYVLRLTASDTAASSFDDVQVTVPGNLAPSVNAGADQTVVFGSQANLNGSATDDGLPANSLTVSWSQVSGPGTASFANPTAAVTTATFSAEGTYVLRLTASDTALSASDDVTVNVVSSGTFTASYPVVSGTDDAEQKAGKKPNLTSSDMDMMLDGSTVFAAVGVRIAAVSIPQGATINSAYIQFRSDEVGSGPTDLTIRVQTEDNPATFAAVNNNITARPVSGSSVAWTPTAWTATNQTTAAQRTPDLAVLLQGQVNRSGWTSGNAIVFIITGTGAGTRVADSIEGGYAPTLVVNYTIS
jgi:hypothetical protein